MTRTCVSKSLLALLLSFLVPRPSSLFAKGEFDSWKALRCERMRMGQLRGLSCRLGKRMRMGKL